MVYTMSEAAKAVGKTRQALMAQIGKGRISAAKNELGQWEIDPAELHRVYPPITLTPVNNAVELHSVAAEKEAEIKVLQTQLDAMKQLLREIEQSRDDWKDQANKWHMQAIALPTPEKEEAPKKSFFRRLFG